MEDISSLIDFYHPLQSKSIEGLDQLEFTWKFLDTSQDSVKLHYRNLKHLYQEAKASLCIVHGFGEHSEKYIEISVHFALRGFEVHMIDFRHLGYSTGARGGHDLLELQEDIYVLLKQARQDLPCFVLGHSMGGLLVSTVLINNPELKVNAVISAPLYKTEKEMNWVLYYLGCLLYPFFQDTVMNSQIKIGTLSRDPVFCKNLLEDRKIIPFYSLKFGLSMIKHILLILGQAKKFQQRVIFMHGSADKLTCPKMTERFHRLCGSREKTLKILPGNLHQLIHDVNKDQVITQIINWCELMLRTSQNLGKINPIKIGYPGLPKRSWIQILIQLLLFLIWAYQAYRFTPKSSNNVLYYLSKLFWPFVSLKSFLKST